MKHKTRIEIRAFLGGIESEAIRGMNENNLLTTQLILDGILYKAQKIGRLIRELEVE